MKFSTHLLSTVFFSLPCLAFATGALENPANGTTESGIGIISGWHCTASKVEVLIDDKPVGNAYVGSTRADTATVCNGKWATGFSFLINFNDLTRGTHNIKVRADGVQFGQSTINTTQSGGESFLRGVTKQVTVPDFPKAGSNATLTWNQSKQSFVVTSIQTGTSSAPATGIAKLYGNVTFTYKFSGSTTVFTDSASLSAANLSSDGYLYKSVRNGTAQLGCAATDTSPEFLCIIAGSGYSGVDVFLFDVSSTGAISGKYEYCSTSMTVQTCVSDLYYTPDGVVSGTVIRTTSIKSTQSNENNQKMDSKIEQINSETEAPTELIVTDDEKAIIDQTTETLKKLFQR